MTGLLLISLLYGFFLPVDEFDPENQQIIPSRRLEELIHLSELCVDLLQQNEDHYAEVRNCFLLSLELLNAPDSFKGTDKVRVITSVLIYKMIYEEWLSQESIILIRFIQVSNAIRIQHALILFLLLSMITFFCFPRFF